MQQLLSACRSTPTAWLLLQTRRLSRAFLILCLLFACSSGRAAGTDILVSPDHAGISLDKATLRAIFTMRMRQWPDGASIHVFVMEDDSDTHDLFCREQLGIYPYVLRGLWDRLVFTGTGFGPSVVHNEAEMKSRVRTTPGAIGYVKAGAAGGQH